MGISYPATPSVGKAKRRRHKHIDRDVPSSVGLSTQHYSPAFSATKHNTLYKAGKGSSVGVMVGCLPGEGGIIQLEQRSAVGHTVHSRCTRVHIHWMRGNDRQRTAYSATLRSARTAQTQHRLGNRDRTRDSIGRKILARSTVNRVSKKVTSPGWRPHLRLPTSATVAPHRHCTR